MSKLCRGGKPHRGVVRKDPEVESACGPAEVWTTSGVKEVWLCAHHRACEVCGKVLDEQINCPLNYHQMIQDRRWR